MSITCLIPFYNENHRLLRTLREIAKVNGLDKIICVDDGSTDNSTNLIKENFPYITLIQLKKNQGKSAAVRQGLKKISTDWTLLLDADLQNLKAEDITHSIKLLQKEDSYDMLILRLNHRSKFVKLIRHDILMSGERFIKTATLKKIFKKSFSGYQLEVAINNYMQTHDKRVAWTHSQLDNTYKLEKWQGSDVIKKYLEEWSAYTSYAGPLPYLKQVINFAHKEIS